MSDARTVEAFDGDPTGRDAAGGATAAASGSAGASFLVETGYCGRCGYDLRGSPGPRCPECGSRIDPDALGAARWWTERRSALRGVLFVQAGACIALFGPPAGIVLSDIWFDSTIAYLFLMPVIPFVFAAPIVGCIATACGVKWCVKNFPLLRHRTIHRSLYSVRGKRVSAFGALLATMLILASVPIWPYLLVTIPVWLPVVATIMAVVEIRRLRRPQATGSALIIPSDVQRNLRRLVRGVYALLTVMGVGAAVFVRALV